MSETRDQLTDRLAIANLLSEVRDLRAKLDQLTRAQDNARTRLPESAKFELENSDGDVVARLGGSDTGEVVEYVDGPTPNPPLLEADMISAGPGQISVRSEGLDVYEEPAPKDFHVLRVHVSLDPLFEPSDATAQGRLSTPKGVAGVTVEPGLWHVGIEYETKSGKLSGLSEVFEIEVAPLVDADEIQEALDQAQERIDEAAAEAQERFDELEEKLGDVAGFDPSEIEQELSEISNGLNEAKQDAANMFEQFEGEIAPQALIDKLIAQEAWIGGALLKDGAVEAEHITASESLSAKIGEFLKLSVVDLVAGTGQIDEGVIAKLWSDVVVANMVTAEEAFIGGALIRDNTIDVEKINVTEELTAAIGQFLTVKADMLEANAIDGMTITGSTLQTRPEAQQGIKIRGPENDISAYDNAGQRRFHVDGNTGHLTATNGEFRDGSVIGSSVVGGYVGTAETGRRVYMEGTDLTAKDSSNNTTARIGPAGLSLTDGSGNLQDIGPHIYGGRVFTAQTNTTGFRVSSGNSSWSSFASATWQPVLRKSSNRYRVEAHFVIDGVALAAGRETWILFNVQARDESANNVLKSFWTREIYTGDPMFYVPRGFTVTEEVNWNGSMGTPFRVTWRCRARGFTNDGNGIRISNIGVTVTPI